jgi:hypothetical protein
MKTHARGSRTPKRKKEKPAMTDDPKPRPVMHDLAKKLDAAVREVETKRQAVDAARATFDAATSDHSAAVNAVRELHSQYDAAVQEMFKLVDATP